MKFSIKRLFKRHVALIILLVILLVFPISLSSQAKLNMRIIVTGLAIDKDDDGYEVTAQIVKATPGTESPGTSATLDFVSEKAETVSEALLKLTYKTGKVSAFSHTNFVVLGNEIAKEDATKCLDIFVRDKVIRNSAMVLFAKDKAGDEIKKTKTIELSVGLGLQKVFLYKQEESDGFMTTVLEFLSKSNMYSKTSYASALCLESGEESGGGGSGEEASSSSDANSDSGQGSGGGGSSGGSSGGESGGSGGEESPVFFKPDTPILVFVEGKLVCKLEETDEILGFLFACTKTKRASIVVDNIENEKLKDAKVSVTIKNKSRKLKFRYEDEIPCLDLCISVNDADIVEILGDECTIKIEDSEYDAIQEAMKKTISSHISKAFEEGKENGADIFGAYELAYKYKYNETKNYYDGDTSKFIQNLKINVCVTIKKLEY